VTTPARKTRPAAAEIPGGRFQWLTDYASQFFQAGHPALEAARRAPLGEFPTWSARERLVANIERA